MASYLDNQKITTAIDSNCKLQLDSQHITTANFMQLNPVYIKEMVPGEKVSLNVETLSRMNPLAVPTFGRANIHLRAFFVPFRTIFRGWNDFITDAPHTYSDTEHSVFSASTAQASLIQFTPRVTNRALVNAFTYEPGEVGNNMVQRLSVSATSDSYDFAYDNGNEVTYRKFSNKGRQAYKVLTALGYAPVFNNAQDDTSYSALPLLAFAKIYADWYFPTQYYDSLLHSYIDGLCNFDSKKEGDLILNYYDVFRILSLIYVSYDSDYFVSAFDNANSPSDGTYSNFKLTNMDNISSVNGIQSIYNRVGTNVEKGYITNNSTSSAPTTNRISGADAPFITPYVGSDYGSSQTTIPTPISQYLLNALRAMTDYMKRHQFAGSRAFDRYLARFGKGLAAEKMNRCNYIGGDYIPLQIGDVMSTSDTTGATLGSYAGKGMAYGTPNTIQFDTDEFGYIIVTSSIVPAIGYYQGIRPLNERISKLQFFTPEYENVGVEAISSSQLYRPMNQGAISSTAMNSQIFGYVPRYASYKVSFDTLSGNFRVPTLNGSSGDAEFIGSDSWHLMREFDDSDFGNVASGCVHSLNFVYAAKDGGQYNRIFNNANEEAPDQFTMIYNFNCNSYFPGKALYDTYEFEDKGKKLTMEVGGVKMN